MAIKSSVAMVNDKLANVFMGLFLFGDLFEKISIKAFFGAKMFHAITFNYMGVSVVAFYFTVYKNPSQWWFF
jgi:hypothetical protein